MCFIWFQIFVGVGVQLAEKAKQRPVINYFSNPKYLPVNLPVCKSAAFEIIKYPVSLILFIYPRPTKGILVAIAHFITRTRSSPGTYQSINILSIVGTCQLPDHPLLHSSTYFHPLGEVIAPFPFGTPFSISPKYFPCVFSLPVLNHFLPPSSYFERGKSLISITNSFVYV